jgi:DnaJ-class molecular chaperone
MAFEGWPPEAFAFYAGLEADNAKPYWTAHRATFDTVVHAPLAALVEELEPRFGPGRILRPYRDVRFAKDKSPYRTSHGAMIGDVYVQVHVKPDPRFVREGDDIFSTVDLTITDAALGVTVTVPTLDGDIELEFDEGTQPGEVRVLRGRGMPVLQGFGRGDQRILVNVAVPRNLTAEQRRLLEEFEGHAHDGTYRHDEGFFEKLKSAFR